MPSHDPRRRRRRRRAMIKNEWREAVGEAIFFLTCNVCTAVYRYHIIGTLHSPPFKWCTQVVGPPTQSDTLRQCNQYKMPFSFIFARECRQKCMQNVARSDFLIAIQQSFFFFFFFLWIGLCAVTVLGTTRGTLLSGRAACFWNNDLDKNPTTAFLTV